MRQLAPGGNGQEWVLARGLCTFTTLDGAAVPERKRRGFVEMSLARWSPFADPQSHVEWSGDRAMVWTWSKSRALSLDDEPKRPPRRILPESLFRGLPQVQGEELVALDEGVEGRVWRDGTLAASRWWPQAPALQDWNEFRRGAGLPPATTLPEVMPYPLAERAWTAQRLQGIGGAFSERQRTLLAMLAVAAAAAVLTALLVGIVALKVSIWQVERQIAEREATLEQIIGAREAALRSVSAVRAGLALRPPGGQEELLSLANRLMRGRWQLLEWRMPDAQTLQLTASMPGADPRAIVKAWEDSGRFADITAELGPRKDQVRVKARVLPPAAPKQPRGAGK